MLRWVAGAALMLGAAQARAADVQVAVDNVADATGSVRVDVCAANQWLTTDCTLKGAAPARPGTTVVTEPGASVTLAVVSASAVSRWIVPRCARLVLLSATPACVTA